MSALAKRLVKVSKRKLGRDNLSATLLLGLGKEVGVLLVRRHGELGLGPEVGGQVRVSVTNGSKGGLDKVTQGTGGTESLGVAVSDTSELEKLLGDGGSDDTGTAGGRDQTGDGGTALSGDLAGNGVGLVQDGTPVTATDGDDGQLGEDDGTTDGSGNLLGALDTETDVAVGVTNDDESLEAGTLTGTGLLLDGHDLHDLVLEGRQEVVDDLVLLDREGEEVDLLDRLDLAVLDETSELGDGSPGLLLILASTATSTTTTAVTSAATTTVTTSKTTTSCKFAKERSRG